MVNSAVVHAPPPELAVPPSPVCCSSLTMAASRTSACGTAMWSARRSGSHHGALLTLRPARQVKLVLTLATDVGANLCSICSASDAGQNH
jgi:hypothetical protein